MKTRIAFFDTKPYDKEFFEKENQNYGFEIKFLPGHLNPDTAELCRGADTVCAFVNDDVGAEVIKKMHSEFGVKLVAMRCAGYNNVDLKEAYEKVHVVRVPSYSPPAVAEHTMALILGLNRKTHKAYSRVRDNNFSINGLLGFDLAGKKAGVIGTGQIGREVIKRMKGFDLEVLAYDPKPDADYAKKTGIEYTDIDKVFRESDILSLHCPLTPENVHLINSESISKMKDGVMLINTGRGKLINSKDLIEGLKSGKIGYAGLDVYEEEDRYFFEDFSGSVIQDDILARLITFPNVLITSHQGFFTKEALQNIASTTLKNIQDFVEDRFLENEICYRCNRKECRREKEGKCF